MRIVAGFMAALLSGSPVQAQVAYTPQIHPAIGPSTCPGGLCQAEGLDRLFAALADVEDGGREQPVHILQLGDSHTAGDRITGALRARLQTRFGNAGRGVLAPGVPYAGYAPFQVEVVATDWTLSNALLTPRDGFGQIGVGLAGTRSPSFGPAADLRLTFEPGSAAARIGVCGRAAPGAGMVVRSDDGDHVLNAPALERGIDCGAVAFPTPSRELALTAPEGWDLYDLFVTTGRPGVIVSSLGVVGATVRDLAARDEAVASAELAFWRPDLIVLAFGTNEGFEDGLDATAYEALLRGQIARMRRLAPHAALMILGAPDALRSGATGGCSADGRRAPPPSLAVVRDVQRRVAADMGVAFWDWHGRMGGDCSSDRLATMEPAMMRGDRVHFTSEGADWIGGALADDLMAAYAAWRAERGL